MLNFENLITLKQCFENSSIDNKVMECVEILIGIYSSKNEDNIDHHLTLIEFYKENNFNDYYLHMFHELSRQHISQENYPEAAISLLKLADAYGWSKEETEKKTELYLLAASYYLKENYWEEAINLYDILIEVHQNVGHYHDVAKFLKKQAEIYDLIVNDDRFFGTYYFVSLFGPSVEQVSYVYRAKELERIRSFADRIMETFEDMELIMSLKTDGKDVDPSKNYIQIFPVLPSSHEFHKKRKMKIEPNPMKRNYVENTNVDIFTCSISINKKLFPDDQLGIVLNSYSEIKFFTVEEKFPSIRRRSKVIEEDSHFDSPCDIAIKNLESKIREMSALISKFKRGNIINVSPFTMVLKGTIDAAIGGGTEIYKEAFLSGKYQREPGDERKVPIIKELIDKTYETLGNALRLHKTIIPENMKELHKQLELRYQKLINSNM
eukprot:TRINITY_DN7992_c0_g1_i1.p1 TRINITY_DN7992_c0_g1~~TRINITY_DN7992_c0_g1_i1.p1  ORF type:complete len:484 (-),score=85.78 TRINITY_DN7992_c0_g1_i1:24-1334(-)